MSLSLGQLDSGSQLLTRLLDQQQSLTAVERFSLLHDTNSIDTTDEPDQAKYYRSLLPSQQPEAGYQYGFSVDLDKCSGCKACVVACHTLNGLGEDEVWRRVGTVVAAEPTSRVQHVTTACHHCAEPGCLAGCPVLAYDKDPVTGIVKHLDDQCIGCKYCQMTCPYEVPQYNHDLGIVRKCDMCSQRLSNGEAPACVQACPNEAISIGLFPTQQAIQSSSRLAPGAPDSQITKPTTNYHTVHQASYYSSIAQDDSIDQVADMHWPLAALLVLTQASVGVVLVERILSVLSGAVVMGPSAISQIGATGWLNVIGVVVGALGLGLGGLHLGQPLRAWRVFLGIRTSWLSREAIVFGKYILLLSLGSVLWLSQHQSSLTAFLAPFREWSEYGWASIVMWSAGLMGLVGVMCSAMIYVVTRRSVWRVSRTLPSFLGATLVAGLACAVPVLVQVQLVAELYWCVCILVLSVLAKLVWEYRIRYAPTHATEDSLDGRSRRLARSQLSSLSRLRIGGGVAITPIAVATACLAGDGFPGLALGLAVAVSVVAILSEFCERLIYFASVVTPRMPGTLR
jgi:formate dehydrogenase iron-sulfur subunit